MMMQKKKKKKVLPLKISKEGPLAAQAGFGIGAGLGYSRSN